MGKSYINLKANRIDIKPILNYIYEEMDSLCVKEASDTSFFDLSEVDFKWVENILIGDESTKQTVLELGVYGYVVIEDLNIDLLKPFIS